MHTIIVSPSGDLYGSEKVLLDFLRTSTRRYLVYAPEGLFRKSVQDLPGICCRPFRKLPWLYFRIALRLLTGGGTLYCNEGGHARWIAWLARLFPRKNFVLHLRIVEDCRAERLRGMPDNVRLIAVSRFLLSVLPEEYRRRTEVILDPYKTNADDDGNFSEVSAVPEIGVIGRITETKGLRDLQKLLDYAESEHRKIRLHLFGGCDPCEKCVCDFFRRCEEYRNVEVIHEGFVPTELIYRQIDAVWHFSRVESLGRIFLEALDYKRIFTGFNAGGIGEIGEELGISEALVDPDTENWAPFFLDKCRKSFPWERARKKMASVFSCTGYCRKIEDILYRKQSVNGGGIVK